MQLDLFHANSWHWIFLKLFQSFSAPVFLQGWMALVRGSHTVVVTKTSLLSWVVKEHCRLEPLFGSRVEEWGIGWKIPSHTAQCLPSEVDKAPPSSHQVCWIHLEFTWVIYCWKAAPKASLSSQESSWFPVHVHSSLICSHLSALSEAGHHPAVLPCSPAHGWLWLWPPTVGSVNLSLCPDNVSSDLPPSPACC